MEKVVLLTPDAFKMAETEASINPEIVAWFNKLLDEPRKVVPIKLNLTGPFPPSPLSELVDVTTDPIVIPINEKRILASIKYNLSTSLFKQHLHYVELNMMRAHIRQFRFVSQKKHHISPREFLKMSNDISFIRNLWNEASQQYDLHHSV